MSTLRRSSRIACAFFQRHRRPLLRLAALLVVGEAVGHFCTWKVWAPSTLISFSMVPCMTEIAVITADDRGHAEHDADQGEERTQLVAAGSPAAT